MKIAIIGATGLVGAKILEILEERDFPVTELIPVASSKSIGKTIMFKDQTLPIVDMPTALTKKPQIALFSAGSSISLEWAIKLAAQRCYVIDNSSAWRMHPEKKLIVPEVNGNILEKEDFIIANPNCSTIQMVMVLKPLHDKYNIKHVVVSTYQSVSGSGQKGLTQLEKERKGDLTTSHTYPHRIDNNILPHIDMFLDNGYTKEEMKMILETQKILGDENIQISPTAVRVPINNCHSESLHVTFEQDYELEEIKQILSEFPGLSIQDMPDNSMYPQAAYATGKDEVFVGRLRKDLANKKSLNCWVVADNIRKGAATNAVQIAETLIKKGFL